MNQGQVHFVRIRGRVVPIRGNGQKKLGKYQGPHHGALATGALASMAGQQVAVQSVLSRSETFNPKSFSSIYGKGLKKAAGNPRITTNYSGSFSKNFTRTIGKEFHNFPIKVEKRFDPKALFGVKAKITYGHHPIMGPGRRVTIAKGAGDAVALHEFGHLISSRRKFSINRLYRKAFINITGDMNRGRKALAKTKMVGMQLVRPFSDIPLEMEATGEAIRIATKAKGWRHGAQIGRKLAAPFATYGFRAATVALLGGMVFQGIRNRNNDQRYSWQKK